jgi:arabinan endo-1,5-alpha-L-arabinosidase
MTRKNPAPLLLIVAGLAAVSSLPRGVSPASAQAPPAAGASTNSATPPPLSKSPALGVVLHDPSTVVKCKDEFWVFYTGRGVPSYHSKDLATWERGPQVFTNAPAWIARAVPANRGLNYWAPDVISQGGRYLLYYSVSSFGKNTSAIGLATNPTLDTRDPAYQWTDQGMVIESAAGDDFNTIDPAIFQDADGTLWLSFGSFWSGIGIIELDPATGKRLTPDFPVLFLAHHDSIEASYIYQKDGWYYLFVDWGMCCRGANSTYNIRVGRSRKVTGPYLDKQGADMLYGGGSLFLDSTGSLIGPGHAGIIFDNGAYWFSCHFEADTARGGRSTLAIMPLRWNGDGWPEVELKKD